MEAKPPRRQPGGRGSKWRSQPPFRHAPQVPTPKKEHPAMVRSPQDQSPKIHETEIKILQATLQAYQLAGSSTTNNPLSQTARVILRARSPVPTKGTDIQYIPPRSRSPTGPTGTRHSTQPQIKALQHRKQNVPRSPRTSRSLRSSHGTSSSPNSTTWEPSPRSPHLPQPKYTRGARNPTLPKGQAAVISDSPPSNPKIIHGTWKFISLWVQGLCKGSIYRAP